MAYKTWTGVPGPGVTGWIVRWHARQDDRTIAFEQIPALRVLSGKPVIVKWLFQAGPVTGLCAVIELDDDCVQHLAGRLYLVAFNNDDQRPHG